MCENALNQSTIHQGTLLAIYYGFEGNYLANIGFIEF